MAMRFHLVLVLGSILFLNRAPAAVNQLTDAEKGSGWKLLFDGKSSEGWRGFKKPAFPEQGWTIEDGWLHGAAKGGDLITDGQYEQFDLRWEWKLEPAGNSGLKYFVSETGSSAVAHEYQMLDDERHPDGRLGAGKRVTAAFYDVLKPTVKPPVRPMGEINQSRILVQGNHAEHWLNGVKVLEYELGSPEVKAAVAESKFKAVPGFGTRKKGHILLQYHQSHVWFRNIKLRELK